MFLLDDVLMAPIHGVIWLAERVQEAAEAELYDEAELRRQLVEAQEQWFAGELSESEYQLQEDRLLGLLEEARQRNSKRR